jgi:hypothetical protein
MNFPPFNKEANKIILKETTVLNNAQDQGAPPSKHRQNDEAEIVEDSLKEFEFMMETALELMMLNPKKFSTRCYSVYVTTKQWTCFLMNRGEEASASQEQVSERKVQLRAEFRIELFKSSEIIE